MPGPRRDSLAFTVVVTVLVCLGASAAKALLNTAEPINRLRGRVHDYRGWPVVCTYHPASLLPEAMLLRTDTFPPCPTAMPS